LKVKLIQREILAMKKYFIFALIIVSITAVSGFSQQQEGMAGQEGAAVQNGKQMMETKPGMTGPGMSGHSGYAGLIDPRTMGAMIGYVMKPNMIKTFENDPAAYQYVLDQTEGLIKKLLIKMFDYYEAIRKPNTKPRSIQKIEKEIVDLRWQIYEKGTKQK
jgi:hypothetical protein